MIAHLTATNANIFLLSSHFKDLPLVEETYQTPYSIEGIPERLKKSLDSPILNPGEENQMSFPVPNRFVPENFDLINRLE